MADIINNELLLDDVDAPIIMQDECAELKSILQDFVQAYTENSDKPVSEWLSVKLQEYLPDRPQSEINSITSSIIASIEVAETKKTSLTSAINMGRSKESWFASEIQNATSSMSSQQTIQYMTNLESAVNQANESLYRTITTQTGTVNQNPRLDGFIAEQYHAQTFNMNAEATGSKYRAEVLEPKPGETYKKNSVDIVIKDGNGKIVRRYQSKYCKDAAATEQAFEHGDYRGQRKLVPKGQESEISKKCSTVLEAPDGTKSNPLSKARAEQMRDEAQSGKWNDLNWNEYQTKDLALGIGKQAGYAALQGAAIGVGFDVAKKLWNGEKIKGEEIIETALVSGTDFGVKAAAAGAIKVGVEKEIITVIPKGTPASTIANIAFVAIEDVKVIGKMFTGELSFKEGIEKIEQTTVSTAAGLATMGETAAIGASIGTVFGPVGSAIGGFIGGTVGYIAGSKVGEAIVKGAQKIRDKATQVVKSIGNGIKSIGRSISSGVKNFCRGVANLFG